VQCADDLALPPRYVGHRGLWGEGGGAALGGGLHKQMPARHHDGVYLCVGVCGGGGGVECRLEGVMVQEDTTKVQCADDLALPPRYVHYDGFCLCVCV
jgi:hypothetical protein